MRYRWNFFLLGAVALSTLCPAQLAASSFLLTFSGVIDEFSTTSAIPLGTPFSGEAIYNTPGTIAGASPSLTNYWLTGPGAVFDITVGGYVFSAGPGPNAALVTVGANVSFDTGFTYNDYLSVENTSDPTSTLPGFDIYELALQITGPPGALLSSQDLPTSLDPNEINYEHSNQTPTSIVVFSHTQGFFTGFISNLGFEQILDGSGTGSGGNSVPEIDPASGTTALALLSGILLVIRGRSDRRLSPAA